MKYSQEEKQNIITSICESISGGLSLRKTLREKKTISRVTFFKWIEENKELANQYARATQEREDLIFEDILNIADNNGEDIRMTDEGLAVTNHDVIQRARLRVDARKWALSKMNPKKYGDKNETTLLGDEQKPIAIINLGSGVKPE